MPENQALAGVDHWLGTIVAAPPRISQKSLSPFGFVGHVLLKHER
jgi:hypothetical protein